MGDEPNIVDQKLVAEATTEELVEALRRRSSIFVLYAVAEENGMHYRRLSGESVAVLGVCRYLEIRAEKVVQEE